jgi:membrane associated rhomboid family serine protease
MGAPPRDDGPDWVESLVKVCAALGMSPVRVRWKLLRLQQRLQRSRRGAEVKVDHLRYAHQTCPACFAVADRAERRCPQCGARLGWRPLQVVGRLGLAVPEFVSMSSLLGAAMIAIYARMIIAEGGGLAGFSIPTLLRFNAHWPPLVWHGEWWRLGTAIFLHIGVWHIGFNVLGLAQVGPAIEHLYGRARMLFFFMATGVLANLGSEALGLHAVQAGASGALMGLIGVAAGWGQRDGTQAGRDVRNRMLRWALIVMVFGLFVHADNAAHGAGFVSGALIGYLVPARSARDRALRPLWVGAGLLGALAAIGAVLLAIVPLPGRPVAPASPHGPALRESFHALRVRCAARPAATTQAATAPSTQGAPMGSDPDDDDGDECARLAELTRWCATAPAPAPTAPRAPEADAARRSICDALRE